MALFGLSVNIILKNQLIKIFLENIILTRIKRRIIMNNYMNEKTVQVESNYILSNEETQDEWIRNTAKQAAKLISDQIKESSYYQNMSKQI